MAVLPPGFAYLRTLEDSALRKLYAATDADGAPCLCEEVFFSPPPAPDTPALRACSTIISSISSPFLGKYTYVQPDSQRRSVLLISKHEQDFSVFTLFTAYGAMRPPVSEDNVWRILYGTLSGLAYLHSPLSKTVLVHGAVSPISLYVAQNGVGLLRSLWSVRESGAAFTGSSYSPLTPYVAPEVLKTQKITTKADIWALGCVVYELCTQQQLFSASDETELVTRILTPVSVNISPQYSQDLTSVLRAMLNPNPNVRPAAVMILSHPRFEHFDASCPEDYDTEAADRDLSLSRLVTMVPDSVTFSISSKSGAATPLPKSDSPLSQAVVSGNKTAFTKALGAWRGKLDSNGYSSLMYAIVYGNVPLAKLLIKTDIGLRDKQGQTALMYAAAANNVEIMQGLLKREAGLHDSAGRTALMHAASADAISAIRTLIPLESGLSDKDGSTALMAAIVSGACRAMSLLYVHEARYQSPLGKTALMTAAQVNCEVGVTVLAEEEAYLEDAYGRTAAQYAEQAGSALPYLSEREEDTALVVGKTVAGRLSTAPKLGIKGTALTKEEQGRADTLLSKIPTDVHGNTPLMQAILAGDKISAESYLSVQMGFRNKNSETALMLCSKTNLASVASQLLPAEACLRIGINPHVSRDRIGMTALMYAAEADATDVCKVLLNTESGLTRKDRKTALIIAALANAKKSALVLAACDKEVGTRDINGFTALMGAAQHGNIDLAKLLVEKEAGMQKSDGTAAIHIAALLENVELTRLLHAREKDLQMNDGRTARDIATALDNPALLDIFEGKGKKRRGKSRPVNSRS